VLSYSSRCAGFLLFSINNKKCLAPPLILIYSSDLINEILPIKNKKTRKAFMPLRITANLDAGSCSRKLNLLWFTRDGTYAGPGRKGGDPWP